MALSTILPFLDIFVFSNILGFDLPTIDMSAIEYWNIKIGDHTHLRKRKIEDRDGNIHSVGMVMYMCMTA